jgi:hypothetical protein
LVAVARRARALREWVRWKRFAVRIRAAAALDGISWFLEDGGRALRGHILRARVGIERGRQLVRPRRGLGGRRLGRMAAVAALASVLAMTGWILSGLGAQEDPRSLASVGGGPGLEGTPPPAVARDRSEVAGVRTDRRRQHRRRWAPSAQAHRSPRGGESPRSSPDENEPVRRPVSRPRPPAAPKPRSTPVPKPAPRQRVNPPPRQTPSPDNFSGSQPSTPPPPPPQPPLAQSSPDDGHPHGGPPGQQKPPPENPESNDPEDD